eukprot:5248450-Alexandrium_andersonii.AAC.1
MAEPPNARHSLVHCVVVQAALAQDRARQDSPGLAVLDDEDRQGRIAAVLGEEATRLATRLKE